MAAGLTRAEAARYLGFQSVEGIRHLQKAGRLRATRDKNGHFRFDEKDLEQAKLERQRDGLSNRLSTRELSAYWENDDFEAENAKWWAQREAEKQRQDELGNQYRRAIAEFEANSFDTTRARAALGDLDVLSFRELVRQGLLREVVPPDCPRGLLVQHVGAGPFYDRAEVLALRREMLAIHVSVPKDSPPDPLGIEHDGEHAIAELAIALLVAHFVTKDGS